MGSPNTLYTRSRTEGASSIIKNRKHFMQHADKHSLRVKRAAVGTLKQLLSLAIDRINLPATDNVSLPQHQQQTRKAPKSEISGPFSSQGKIAGSGRQYTHYAQMPPKPTCFELINLLFFRCPSLFLSKNNSFKDSIDCSILLRTKACPVSTTTLYSEFRAVPNMMQYIESKDFNQPQMKQQPKSIKSRVTFPHGIVFPFCLLGCIILASIVVNFKKSCEFEIFFLIIEQC
jgi:hypothetical protein